VTSRETREEVQALDTDDKGEKSSSVKSVVKSI
jgi:hypothetical protein